MNTKNILAASVAATAGGLAAPADATLYTATLTQVLLYSNGATSGQSGNITSSSATWSYDDTTSQITQTGGLFNVRFTTSPTGTLWRTSIAGLVMGNGGAASASTYICAEGNFGPGVGASICGNYSFGANFFSESTTAWGPGTAVSRTIGGDDLPVGPQQSVALLDGMTTITWTGTTLVLRNATCTGMCTTTTAGLNNGQRWTFAVVPVPAAAWLFGAALGTLGLGEAEKHWQAMSSPVRPAAYANALLLLASILLGGLALEGAARYLKMAPAVLRLNPGGEESAFRFSDNPVLGYEWKASYRNEAADLQQSFPATNRDGFRDVERSLQKTPGTRRIVLLGDSVAAGVGIRDINDLISRQLEKRLAADGYEVLNFGVPGYCTYGEVELLATRGLAYRPDQVLLLFVENDYVPGNFLFAQYTFERPPGVDQLFLHSALFRWASLRWDWFQFGAMARSQAQPGDPDVALARDPYRRFHDAVGQDDDTVTRALTRLKALADEGHFGVTVAIWPRFSSSLILEGDHELVGNEIRAVKVARDLGFPVLMLSDAFRADYARTLEERGLDSNALDLYTLSREDPMHPNAHGAAVAAGALAAAFSKPGANDD